MHASTDVARLENLVTAMSERMATITRTLGTWVQQAPHDLQEIEEHVLRIVKDLGATLVAGLCSLLTPTQPALSWLPSSSGVKLSWMTQVADTVVAIVKVKKLVELCQRWVTCKVAVAAFLVKC